MQEAIVCCLWRKRLQNNKLSLVNITLPNATEKLSPNLYFVTTSFGHTGLSNRAAPKQDPEIVGIHKSSIFNQNVFAVRDMCE